MKTIIKKCEKKPLLREKRKSVENYFFQILLAYILVVGYTVPETIREAISFPSLSVAV